MSNLYRVVYSRENGLRRTIRVWSQNSAVAIKTVKGKEDVDHIVRVSRTKGILVCEIAAAIGILAVAAPVVAIIVL